MSARRLALPAALVLAAGSAVAEPTLTRSCARHGPGFVEAPGTANCIRISGRVVAGAGTTSRRVSRDDIVGMGASGRVSLDLRTDTEHGPFRAYLRLRAGSAGPR